MTPTPPEGFALDAPAAPPPPPEGFTINGMPPAGGSDGPAPSIPGAPVGGSPSTASAFAEGAKQGLSLGLADELQAARTASGVRAIPPSPAGLVVQGALSLGGYVRHALGFDNNSYDTALEANRARVKAAEEAHPGAFIGGQLAGAAALPIAPLASGATLPARLAGSAATGAALGGAAGFGEGEGIPGRLAGAATGALGGGVIGTAAVPVGAALGAAGRGIGYLARAGRPAEGPEIAAAAERLGVALPRAVTSDAIPTQQMGQVVSQIPVAGAPLVNASERAIGQLGEAAARAEQGFGSGSAANAGEAVRAGIAHYIKTESQQQAERLYGAVDQLVNPATTVPLNATDATARSINFQRSAAALKPSSAVNEIADAIARGEGLTYQGAKMLRTRIGEMLDTGLLPADTSKAELKRIYGALTDDLRTIVSEAGGPQASEAFDQANRIHASISARREALAKIVGSRSDEGIFEKLAHAAGTGGSADIKLLGLARETIGPDAWGEVASAVIARMGRDASGEFSPRRFLTAYSKLSSDGRAALFHGTGRADLAQALDDIATVSKRFKQLDRFANPSGTARNLLGGAAAFGIGGAAVGVMEGKNGATWLDPLTALGGATSATAIALMLSRPASARALANWSMAYARSAEAMTPRSAANLDRATNALAVALGNDIGVSAPALLQRLQTIAPLRARTKEQ